MKKIFKFFESIYFLILINAITILCWYYQRPDIAFFTYIIILILIIITKTNRIVFASLLLSGNLNYFTKEGGFDNLFNTYFPMFLPLGIIALIVIVIDIIKNFKHITFKNPILYGLILILIANVLSVVNIRGQIEESKLYINAAIGIGQLIGYAFIFISFMNMKDDKSQLYFSKVTLFTSLAITVELILHFINLGELSDKGDYNLGWGVSNSIAMFYSLMIPTSFYSYIKNQKNIFILFAVGINAIMMLLMLSRGAYLTFGILVLPFIIVSFFLVEKKKKYVFDLFITFLVCIVGGYIIIKKFEILDIILTYLKSTKFFDPNGRKEIFQVGIDLFKEYWLLGAGSYSGMTYLQPYNLYTYHNYWIHTLATTGIIGLIAFLYYLLMVFKMCFIKNAYNILAFFSILVVLIHGLVDNTFYNPKVMIFLSILLPLLFKKPVLIETEKIDFERFKNKIV